MNPIPHGSMMAGSDFVGSRDRSTFASDNPATSEIVGSCPEATPADIDASVEDARTAFDRTTWGYDAQLRAAHLRAWIATMEANREILRELVVREGGVPIRLTTSVQLDGCFDDLSWIVEAVESRHGAYELVPMNFHDYSSERIVYREPVGVVAVFTPNNFPAAILLKRVFTVLGAGNTVVVKPSPDTSLTALMIGRLAHEAGLPPGVLNVVTSSDSESVGAQLCDHPGVDAVSFTGSTKTGRSVAARCAAAGKHVVTYLGGKSAHLVLDDADIVSEVASARRVCFHAGQACTLYTRLLVPRAHYEESLEILADAFESVIYGDPWDPEVVMGPLVSARTKDEFLSAIRGAERDGGRIICGGNTPEGLSDGYFVEPTVVADLSPDAHFAATDIVGPALCVLPYDTVDDAIAIANAVPYAQAAAISSASVQRAMSVARRIRAGAVSLNGGLPYGADSPYQGMYASGSGHNGGAASLDEYTATKVVGVPKVST